ncbi:MAG: tetratricopeptide repeat protein [Flavobacteriales bacterium]|nr:tetratricopeptide repeat protein [Flavobacteriales bacterium]
MRKITVKFFIINWAIFSLYSCGGIFKNHSEDALIQDSTLSLVVKEWSKMINENPENDEYIYKRGLELAKDNRPDLALLDMQRAIKLSPNNANYLIGEADVYMAQNETKKALESYKKAVEVDGKNETALLSLGRFYYFVRQFDNAKSVLEKLEKVNSANAEGLFYQGMIWKENKDTTEAIKKFQKVTQIDLYHHEALIQLGQLYAAKNDTIGLAYFHNALLANPDSDEAAYSMGFLYQNLGLLPNGTVVKKAYLDSAMVYYQKTIDLNAQHYLAYYNVGYINFWLNNIDRANEHFLIAVKFAPEFTKGHYMIGLCHETKGQNEQAKALYEKCLKIEPDFEKAKLGLKRVSK